MLFLALLKNQCAGKTKDPSGIRGIFTSVVFVGGGWAVLGWEALTCHVPVVRDWDINPELGLIHFFFPFICPCPISSFFPRGVLSWGKISPSPTRCSEGCWVFSCQILGFFHFNFQRPTAASTGKLLRIVSYLKFLLFGWWSGARRRQQLCHTLHSSLSHTDPKLKSQPLYFPQLQKNSFCNWDKQHLAGIYPQTHWNNWEIDPQLHSANFSSKHPSFLDLGCLWVAFQGTEGRFGGFPLKVGVTDNLELLLGCNNTERGILLPGLARAAAWLDGGISSQARRALKNHCLKKK